MLRHHTKTRHFLILLVVLVTVLVALRVMAPIWIRDYAEETLDKLEGFDSEIADVDLFLWRGAYEIEGLSLVKTDGDVPVPFFSTPEIDLSIQWSELVDGALVGEIYIHQPELYFVAGPSEAEQQSGIEASWASRVEELFPFRINRLEVVDGEIHYRDFTSQPNIDLALDQLHGVVANLTNSDDLSESLAATVDASARVESEGRMELEAQLDPYAERPTFKSALELSKVPLPEINDFLRAYANVDAESGTFAFYSEIESKDGRYTGYVKPILENVDILVWRQEEEGFWHKVWEGAVEVAAKILENPNEDRVASQVPIEGSFDDPEVDLWSAIGSLFRNAFIEAIRHGVEGRLGSNLGGTFDSLGDGAEPEEGE